METQESSDWVKRYRSDPRFYLGAQYRNMRARVKGKTAGDGKSQLWLGLPLVPRLDYIEWALKQPGFWMIWNAWPSNNFERRFSPSVDRLEDEGGYIFENMAFVPHHENSEKALAKGRETRKAKSA